MMRFEGDIKPCLLRAEASLRNLQPNTFYPFIEEITKDCPWET
jgi:hypothetical protein